jgi:hypothetical protein
LRISENRVLRKIFASTRDEVIGRWKKLYNEQLHNLKCSPNIIVTIEGSKSRWERHVARMKNILTVKSEGK